MKIVWPQVLLAFVLGAVIGVALDGKGWRRRGHWDSARVQQRVLERFSRELRLTPEQRTQVAAILEKKWQKIDALRAEIRPQFDALRQATSAEIRQLLSSPQQETFDALQAKREARRQAKGGRERHGF